MGLDITAYSHLTPVGKHTDGWCENENHVRAFAYDCFPRSFRGIRILGREENLFEGGCYAITANTRTHGFHAGSYHGYNAWRADLARQFNPEPSPESDPEKPFYELLWFADNEGCIGPEAAADLLVDFRKHADRYAPDFDWVEPAQQKYQDWTRAFELAADGGLVEFR